MPSLAARARVVAITAGFALVTTFEFVARRRRKLKLAAHGLRDAILCEPNATSAARLDAVLGPRDAANLHVIFDFDRTLTAMHSPQCHDVCLKIAKPALQAALQPYWEFSAPGGPPPCRGKDFSTWWTGVHGLLEAHAVTREELDAAYALAAPILRPGAAEALRELLRLRVPVTILSAGMEHVIAAALDAEGLPHTSDLGDLSDAPAPARLRVFTNRLEFRGGAVSGCAPEEPVTSANKRDVYERCRAWFDASGDADRRLLVVGDSVGDPACAGPVPASARLCVGYYDAASPWAKRKEEFLEAYDVLLDSEGGDFLWLVSALRESAGR